MGLYRKKPAVIEARQLTDISLWDVYDWIDADIKEWCWDNLTDKFPTDEMVEALYGHIGPYTSGVNCGGRDGCESALKAAPYSEKGAS